MKPDRTKEEIIADVLGWESFSPGPVMADTDDFLKAMEEYRQSSPVESINGDGFAFTIPTNQKRNNTMKTLQDEAERFFNENYSGTKTSDFLKPYIINTYKAASQFREPSSPTVKEGTEPIAMKAGDLRVMVNGEPVAVDFRIISEELYQKLTRKPLDR